ncbi:MAG TPA: nucleotide exchange factor GrpE, partial [Verrucomicrobiota bacterium]|nr:nucleotide exchange factor GrpE [Verrucomicrobiota bacterium]
MLGVAYFIYGQSKVPLAPWEVAAAGACVALGAVLGVMPFILEYRATSRWIDASAVGAAADKIRNLETIAEQIHGAANLWENAHLQSEKVSGAAQEISERMNAELKDFKEFLKKANDSERATLRLEVDKLRRAEAEWLQMLVRILDHVYALYAAAERSGQQQLIAQISQFQNACRDTVRRAGLVPFVAAVSEPFNAERHKWADGETPDEGSIVAETLATGFTFQGKLIRPALVRLQQAEQPAEEPPEAQTAEQTDAPSDTPAEAGDDQSDLPLQPAQS